MTKSLIRPYSVKERFCPTHSRPDHFHSNLSLGSYTDTVSVIGWSPLEAKYDKLI